MTLLGNDETYRVYFQGELVIEMYLGNDKVFETYLYVEPEHIMLNLFMLAGDENIFSNTDWNIN